MNMNLYSRGDRIFALATSVLIGMFTVATLYPFIYIAAVSFSSGFAATAGKVVLTPIDATVAAYGHVLVDPTFWRSYANTFIYTIGGTAMSLVIIVPGAYALSRPALLGRRFFNLFIAFTMWFNAGLIPFFLNMRDLGLLDSYFGIIIGFACNAFNIILLRNFFESIPRSFEEAGAHGRSERVPDTLESLRSAVQARDRDDHAVLHRVALERILLGDGSAAKRGEDSAPGLPAPYDRNAFRRPGIHHYASRPTLQRRNGDRCDHRLFDHPCPDRLPVHTEILREGNPSRRSERVTPTTAKRRIPCED